MQGWEVHPLSRGIPCAKGCPLSENKGRLPAVCPNMPELLAVMALSKDILNFLRLYPNCDVAEVKQSENLWGFAVLGMQLRNRGRFLVVVPSGERRVFDICLTLTMSKPRLTCLSEMSSAGVLTGRWSITALVGFRDLG
jgi:hypothetical protein